MKLHIHELIIWPEDVRHGPHVIPFDPRKIMVITGWSSRGKSAVTSIIDYVLGAATTAIPIGPIRDKASWYGLTIETDVGKMRIAREKPSERAVSNKYWLQLGEEVSQPLPRRPHGTEHADRVKQLFDGLSRLSDLDTDPAGSGFGGRASFRDMASFNYLPQHIVANPYTMFFKADTTTHREKLRNVMPLALGIMTNEDLALMHQRKLMLDRLRLVDTELKSRAAGVERWQATAKGTFFQAQELGLLPVEDLPGSLEAIIEVLREVVKAGGQAAASPGRVSAAVNRLERLRLDERELDRTIAHAKRRLRRLRSLRGSVSDYSDVLAEQQSRVRGVGWFRDAVVAEECILCGSESEAARSSLSELGEAIGDLEDLCVGASSTPPVVDREIADAERDLLIAEEKLLFVRNTRLAAELEVDGEQGQSQTLEKIYRFIGNTEQALRMVKDIEGDGGLNDQRKEIVRQIDRIDGKLEGAERSAREERANRIVTSAIQRVIELLGIVGADGIPSLNQRELNVQFQRDGVDHTDSLSEIGSGENWMAYHLAMLFALHTVFLGRKSENPVPSFLIIDQPSQVYFPSDTFRQLEESNTGHTTRGEDIRRTQKIFEMISTVCEGLKHLQVIVLEHADRSTWGAVKNVEEAADWRGESGLIPKHWQTEANEL